MRLEALLRAHGFMRTERPAELWEADTDDVRLIPLLGEMIAAGLAGGGVLAEMTLAASNVVVADEADEAEGQGDPAPGEYVALSVSGAADFGPDARWTGPGTGAAGRLRDLDDRLTTARVRFGYIRRMAGSGSITVFLARRPA